MSLICETVCVCETAGVAYASEFHDVEPSPTLNLRVSVSITISPLAIVGFAAAIAAAVPRLCWMLGTYILRYCQPQVVEDSVGAGEPPEKIPQPLSGGVAVVADE
jgi:hypothetical protein